MDLAQRIDRLESYEAIRNLVARYAIAIDAKDLEGLTNLFVDDVRVTRDLRGHAPMKELLGSLIEQFTTSVHFVGAQTIEFTDDDHAEGVVYCKAEHEYGDRWIVMAIQYWDRYERRAGAWQFAGRKVKHWYASDMNDRPLGPEKTRWPVSGVESLPHDYATWDQFWQTHSIPTAFSDRPIPETNS